jgi:uroporphyrinogen-III decarboxylase
MDHRRIFFNVLERKTTQVPFIPDLTTWYLSRRIEPGQEQPFYPGEFIPDDAEIHNLPGSMPEKYKDFTLMDLYRHFDFGFHAHIYRWLKTDYSNGVELETLHQGNELIERFHTHRGSFEKKMLLASDGSWSPHEYFVKTIDDLDVLQHVVESQRFSRDDEIINKTLEGIGSQGQADIVLSRSPFGKLVHEYVGFQNTVYFMMDHQDRIETFMEIQRQKDLEVVELAAHSEAKLVILSDHADETLISPWQYQQHCIPYYQEMNNILHKHVKYVSTHLDGNFKGFFDILGKTGFDYLDGCTPAPMFNYTPNELAQALPETMSAFCGVPSSLFCQNLPTEEILDAAGENIEVLQGRLFLNVGDILPANGDIQQVIALGDYVRRR